MLTAVAAWVDLTRLAGPVVDSAPCTAERLATKSVWIVGPPTGKLKRNTKVCSLKLTEKENLGDISTINSAVEKDPGAAEGRKLAMGKSTASRICHVRDEKVAVGNSGDWGGSEERFL